ncbi:ABC transporter permease [Oleiharenicola lentus]|uniref:ABC transporter permease n=1 Tax=Oleiharenicola lentus TaxID=2508720 RepID=UPI003F676E8C
MITEVRYAFRSLGKAPGFSAAAILILALGIGASTAIFSVVNALLLKPLDYQDSRQLVQIQSNHREQGDSSLAPATFMDLHRDLKSFETIAAQQYYYVNLTKTASPALLTEVKASEDYFKLWGVQPLHGRTWNRAETRSGGAPIAILSAKIWRSQFAAREDIIGETIMLDDVAHTVIGVMPDSFSDPWGNAAIWRPMPMDGSETQNRSARYWAGFARLKTGVTREQANAELAAYGSQLEKTFPENYQGWTLRSDDLQTLSVGSYRTGLFIVLGAVACVLLITCANVAGLAIVRAMSRRKEFAVRAAIGASRKHLILQTLTESLALALLGGSLGVVLANYGIASIIYVVGDGWLPRAQEITLDMPVMLASLALTLTTGVAFGLAPAWSASRADASEVLKDSAGRGSAGPTSRRIRSGLVVVEIALALILLVGAALLGRSFTSILKQNPGMRTEQVLAIGLSLSEKRYPVTDSEARRSFYVRTEQAVSTVPGVVAAGFTQTLPFTWGIPITLIPDGQSLVNDQNAPSAFYDSVSVDFFKATTIPLIGGRTFSEADNAKGRPVVVISAATAKTFFGTENPIGRFLKTTDPKQTTRFEIVGVVGDVARNGLGQNVVPLQIYRPVLQRPPAFATLLVKTAVLPESVSQAVQRAIWSVDPDQAIGSVNTVEHLVANTTTQPRLYLMLFGIFAGIALVLAAVGLYGLVAYSVAQRTREFGIRTALGASTRDVLRLVLKESVLLVFIGLALGLGGSLLSAQLLRQLLFTVSAYDPTVFFIVPTILAAVALLACLIPARRAAKVDPAIALRSE